MRGAGSKVSSTRCASARSCPFEPEARQALRSLLGGDRLATRGELAKLALYCAGTGRVSLADVEAAIGDVSARSQEDMLDAVLEGDARGFDTMFTSLLAGGGNAGGRAVGRAAPVPDAGNAEG